MRGRRRRSTRPRSRATRRSATSPRTPRSCSTTSRPRAELVAHVAEQRPEGLGLTLGETAGGLVEQQHLRARGRARTRDRRCGGSRSRARDRTGPRTRRAAAVRRARRPVARTAASDRATAGRCAAAATGLRMRTARSQATAIVSRTVSAGNSRPSWNERPRPSWARRYAAEARHVDRGRCPAPSTIVPASAAHESRHHVEERGLARTVRSDHAHDLAGAHRERHVGERDDAAEAPVDPGELEQRFAVGLDDRRAARRRAPARPRRGRWRGRAPGCSSSPAAAPV